jgi:hypothetical protein
LKQPSNFPPFRQGIIRKEIIWRAKGQLAFDILTEAFADSIRPDFVCGDKIYGLRTELREYPKTKTRVPERPRSVLLPGESSRCC